MRGLGGGNKRGSGVCGVPRPQTLKTNLTPQVLADLCHAATWPEHVNHCLGLGFEGSGFRVRVQGLGFKAGYMQRPKLLFQGFP